MGHTVQKPLFDSSSTEQFSRELGPASEEVRLPGLTILYHPELSRVGERALLSALAAGRPAALSRLEPAFAAPGSESGPRPLEHRRLSRRPLKLEAREGGVRLSSGESRTRVAAFGEPLADARVFSPDELERGVVLLLGDAVVLLLHLLQPFTDPRLPDLGLVGESPAMTALRRQLRQVADLPVPVLLRGESGTGKELAAAALHRASPRRHGPFVAVNMAAVPAPLAAAELFGAARGAYTGADKRRDGYFVRAAGGTLFLDEVGEMPPEVQTLLLRCLETGEIQPVGGSAPLRPDVRLVAATDADLEAAVAAGSFRAPLLYRLSGFRIDLAPLRERREDFGRLLVELLRQELAATGELGRLSADPPWLPAPLVARLAGEPWPGNVRELRNVLRQLVIAHRGSDRVPAGAAERLLGAHPPAEAEAGSPASGWTAAPAARRPGDVGEEELIAALRRQRWRPHAAARELGIPRPSIYHLMKKSRRVRVAGELGPAELEPVRRRCGSDVTAMAAALEVSETALRRRLRQLGLL